MNARSSIARALVKRFFLAGLLLGPAGLGAAGCSRTPPIFVEPGAFQGPALSIDSASYRTHIATFTLPSGGWSMELDSIREQFDLKQVFVTLREPGAGELVTQSLVEQSLDTRVRTTSNVEVYARVVPRATSAAGGAHRLAGRAEKR
ncbi:MAG: protease complex subunit PrcB family protein [Planctomycetota bacterium]|nr:protease complex subunit PrcB family protein [Planctomycetota bacterium]